VSVVVLPATIVVGLAAIVTEIGGPKATVTVAMAVTVPPRPVAEAVYTVVVDGLTA
jgi:hypothetical protein